MRDLWIARGRTSAMIAAIALSVAAVTAFLAAASILSAEIDANYRAGNPASATLHLARPIEPEQFALARATPGVTDATARATVAARIRVQEGPWQSLLLFASAEDDPQRVGAATIESGSWPPSAHGIFLERTAMPFLGAHVGDRVDVLAPHGRLTTFDVAGAAHDGGVAPADQERTVYARMTTAGLAAMGLPTGLDELEIVVGGPDGPSGDAAHIAAVAQDLAVRLGAAGNPATSIDVPPPLRHPHYGQMVMVATSMLLFGALSLLMSSVLVAAMIGGMLTAQIRQIGAMKAVGATTPQLFGMYLTMTAVIASAATVIAIAPGLLLGRFIAGVGGSMLNLDIDPGTMSPLVIAVAIAIGALVPVLMAVPALLLGTVRSVKDAIDDHGTEPVGATARLLNVLRRLPVGRDTAIAARGLLRRPGRFALTVSLLAIAGTGAITGLNTSLGWDRLVQSGMDARSYDAEVRFADPIRAASLRELVEAVPGVSQLEALRAAPATVHGSAPVDVVHVYPDDSHGSFTMVAPPPNSSFAAPPIVSGRWLRDDDADAVVLTTLAVAQQAPGAVVGDRIALTVNGKTSNWTIAGIAQEFGTQGTAYVTSPEFTAASGTSADTATILRFRVAGATEADRGRALDLVASALDAKGIPVERAFTVDTLRAALDGHVFVLVEALFIIAAIIGIVGLLGLATSLSTSVTERTREYAIMRTIGAKGGFIRGTVVIEGVLTAGAALILATVAALPAGAAFGAFIGQNAFRQALPFTYEPAPLLLWSVLSLAGAVVATIAAANRAAALTVSRALTIS
ncbi:FtsX-like permease family protein [Sinomonas sp. ASV322]|uniref:FtsX-like permease family protein n=1 Tax=Sinomonas sp. ASV322 TaxID=3041920 RepID=UPI0027DE7332|nr:FtsX-like permease family protein [Sinomonas sp. ASV322]MDQ4500766.1 FtsX-like permease family protein [Sinomonas sp. ASV322]